MQSPTHDFRGMTRLMKDYIGTRRAWCERSILTDRAIPPTPQVKLNGKMDLSKPTLNFAAETSAEGTKNGLIEWRLAEVTKGPVKKPLVPRKYEIEPIWQQSGGTSVEIPTKLLKPGATFRVRARNVDASGRASHWSEPVELGPN
jgi:hypothetical protein